MDGYRSEATISSQWFGKLQLPFHQSVRLTIFLRPGTFTPITYSTKPKVPAAPHPSDRPHPLPVAVPERQLLYATGHS